MLMLMINSGLRNRIIPSIQPKFQPSAAPIELLASISTLMPRRLPPRWRYPGRPVTVADAPSSSQREGW
jgi:hypothetical protein